MTCIPCCEGAPYLVYKIILHNCKETPGYIMSREWYRYVFKVIQQMGTSTGQNGVGNERTWYSMWVLKGQENSRRWLSFTSLKSLIGELD